MTSNLRAWVLALGVVGLWTVFAVAADGKPSTYVCQSSLERYELEAGGINEGSVSIRVCARDAHSCGPRISVDEDTDEESTSRRFFGVDQDGREYFLEFWEMQDEGREKEFLLTVELDGVILDHQMTCHLK